MSVAINRKMIEFQSFARSPMLEGDLYSSTNYLRASQSALAKGAILL
mgnify:CR=1 FL=1